MNIRITILMLVLTICNIKVQAQNFDRTKLDQYFQTLNDNNKFMGNISIFRDGKEIYAKSVGFADIDHQIPNSKLSKSGVGSISKMFTSVMVFQAVAAGKLSLSQTIDKYFPSVKNAERITIEHLMAHRSGIHNYTENWEFMQWPAKTREQMIEIILAGGSIFEPDATADYSNSNYVLLSYILEDVYEKSYADILTDQIARPLSLNNTYFGRNIIDIDSNECNSYLYSDKWRGQTVTDPSVTLGAGCIISTPEDLNKFADSLFKGKLISANSLLAMLNIRDDYGMGIFPVPFFSKQGYGHRGGVDGFHSILIYMPDDKISYAITSNGLNYNFTEIHVAVLNCIYELPFDIPNFEVVAINPKILDKYTGIYASSQLPIKVRITKNGNSLTAKVSDQPEFSLDQASEHVFRFTQDNIVIKFNAAQGMMALIQGEEVLYFERE